MHFSTYFAAGALLLSSAIAAPAPPTSSGPPACEKKCVTKKDSEVIGSIFQQLIQNYTTELALDALTEDFVDWSSSVNILMNKGAQLPKNITGPTFDGRAAFMAGQGSQPKIPFAKLNTFYGCDSVSLRWVTARSGNGQKTETASIPVVGNAIISVVPAEPGNKYGFRIKELFSEFNAAAWLVNLGVFKPNGTVLPLDTSITAKRDVPAEAELLTPEELRGPMI